MKYKPMKIKITAKHALGYFILIEITGILISLLILFTDYIRQTTPYLPTWILPTVFAVIFVSIGVGVWQRLSDAEILKDEFITVITHKFRTPLTRIKWAIDDMSSVIPAEKKESIDAIVESDRQLLALTDILVHMLSENASHFDYHISPMDINELFSDLSVQYDIRAKRKGIDLSFSASPGMRVMADAEKSVLILQILLDNSLSYTPAGGSIKVAAHSDADFSHVVIEVSDTGIGMSQETASKVFRRFYRGDNARHADTEGMGIGLFMAKRIAEKQGGNISVKSEGEGKGSTFSVIFPAAQILYTK
jgi:signal transduction histidine kinase